MKIVLFTLLTTLSVSVFANTANDSFTPHAITYSLFGYGLDLGTETRTLTHENNTYTYTARAQTRGLAKLIKNYRVAATSTFTINKHINSNTFHSIEYDGDTIKKQIHLISRDEVITNTLTNQTWESARATFDFLNVFIALARDFKQGNPLTYDVANGKKVKTYAFENKGLSEIDIGGETITVVKLVANTLEVFIAEKYNYLPVFIQKDDWKYRLQDYKQ